MLATLVDVMVNRGDHREAKLLWLGAFWYDTWG
jgi:hypothetical protein